MPRMFASMICALWALIAGGTAFAQSAERQDAMTAYQMGQRAERAGDLESAFQQYQEAVRIGGDVRATVGALVRTANIQMLRGALKDAQESLDEALQREPESPDARLMQARMFLLQDKPRRAVRILEDMSRTDRVAIPAMVGLLEASAIRSDPALMTRTRQRLLAWMGTSDEKRALTVEHLRADADFFAALGKTAVSLFLAELSVSLEPSPETRHLLAMMRYKANQLDAAAGLFQELLAIPKFQDDARSMLAQIEVQRKELQIEAKRARFRELQAVMKEAESSAQFDKAIAAGEEIIAFGAGLFGYETAEIEKKLASLRKHRSEKMAAESKTMASQALRAGRYAEAAELLRRAKTVVGPDLILDGMLAEALLKSGVGMTAAEREKALLEILGLETALPSSLLAQTHWQMGVLLESQKRWNEAIAHYEAAKAKSPDIPEVSKRLLAARIRSMFWSALLALTAAAGLLAAVFHRWPGIHRTVIAYVRHQVALRRGDMEGRYHALSALVALLPHRVDLRRMLAVMAEEKGDEKVMLYLYEQLWRERLAEKHELVKLFDLYSLRGETEKLYEVIRDILRETPEPAVRAKILEAKFRIDFEAERFPEALQSGRTLMALAPTALLAEQMVGLIRAQGSHVDVKTLLSVYRAWLRLQPGAFARIMAEAEALLKTMTESADGMSNPEARELAQFIYETHYKSGDLPRAAEVLELLCISEKDAGPLLETLLKIYSSLRDSPAVLRTSRRLHEALPSNFEFGIRYAQLLEKTGNLAAAEDVHLKLLPHQANSVELVKKLYDTAKAHFESDLPARLDRAVLILRAIVSHTLLDTKEARLMLARILIKKEQMDEAIAILQAIEGGGYPRLRAQSLRAEAFLRKNQPQLAVDILKKVNFDDPQLTDDLRKEMRYLHAEALESQGHLEEAAEILDELILLDITFRDIKTRHDRLAHVKRRREARDICPTCGKPNPPASRFCGSCGAAILQESTGGESG